MLDAERTLLEAQDRLAASQTRTATAFVAVYKARGGGGGAGTVGRRTTSIALAIGGCEPATPKAGASFVLRLGLFAISAPAYMSPEQAALTRLKANLLFAPSAGLTR